MRFTGPFSFEDVTEREWIVTNGLGGYASSTLCGLNSRRYHGLLMAALHPPGQRTLLVAKLEEIVTVKGMEYPLSSNQYPDAIYPEGYYLLSEFELANNCAIQRFAAGQAAIEKQVTMVQGENTTQVAYRNIGDLPVSLTITPLVNARDFHGATNEPMSMQVESHAQADGPRIHVIPWWLADGYWLSASSGEWRDAPSWYYNMTYFWEQRRGLPSAEHHFAPGYFTLSLLPGEVTTMTLSTTQPGGQRAQSVPQQIPSQFENDPPEIRQLYHAAMSFLVKRAQIQQEAEAHGLTVIAGYHWFGDWGRDTMISLPGLCLTTGRYAEAAGILRTFAATRKHGLLPNLFLDSGAGEAYNTVDASLWFCNAVDQYHKMTNDDALVQELRPALEEIVQYYRQGTDFGIRMDTDGLIIADAPGWQLTWMDAKVGDWVVTQRNGKPVEISALWYNALRVMADFAQRYQWDGDYAELADKVRESFQAFWYAQGEYLYDVLGDATIRPNQIFALSVPHSPLAPEYAPKVLDIVGRHLLTPYGLRSLSPEDPAYRGHYGGDSLSRDGSYHQGPVWGWLIGPYVDAYLRVYENSQEAKRHCRELLSPLLAHVWDAGVGSISEIFDGDAPHQPNGTISQAWSVAEVLRVWEKCREG